VPRIQRALVSVSDKRGLLEFARGLRSLGVELLSTGGTHSYLQENGIEARGVSDVTGFPEILDGRVKTLHPKIHGALLAIADNPKHQAQLHEHSIQPIDMVVVNLYPFEQTVSRAGVTLADAVEQIDIGGPTMLRAASKNYRFKAVVVNPDRYPSLLEELHSSGGCLSDSTCFSLAREVFRHTAHYDSVIANYLEAAAHPAQPLPSLLQAALPREQELRYGENPHQQGALYGTFGSLLQKLHGKELSFNNIVDISAAALLIAEFDAPAIAIIKHTNPCGVGTASTLAEAYAKAFATDTKAPYGGIVAANRPLDMEAAHKINEIFTEVILAPLYPEPVLDLLRKKKDRRLIRVAAEFRGRKDFDVRSVPGGLLVQQPDSGSASAEEFRVVTRRQPTDAEVAALRFAWTVAKHVKSNAIVYAASDRTLGVGAGQMSRFDSARIAVMKARDAGIDLRGSVVASDAFFPFADALLEAIHAGSTAVIQPGGSIRDEEVIKAADENDIAMVFTGIRHFRH
jgi:phosphoribosylaminoimidazolecarboxamide formyltransferase/IMP cyclohydrolase